MPRALTSESFTKLLETLSSNEREAAVVYTDLHASLVRYFELKGISEPDKAADETIDRVAEKINQEKEVKDLTRYAFGVAKFVYLEKLRREKIGLHAADEFYSKNGTSKNFGGSDEFEPLRKCFESLYKHEQELLSIYFEDLPFDQLSENRQKMADRENVSLNTLRIRVSRLRKRLEDCLRGIF